LVLKRVSREWDWIMRATGDDQGREALAWTSGLLDRLPAEVTHPILACARDASGWAILMRDANSTLFPPHDPYIGTPISPADDAHILAGLAALHATFWAAPEATNSAPWFCTPENRYRAFSAETGRREVNCRDFYPRIIREGWELLPTLIDADLADLVASLAIDPHPLTSALERYPQTVVHGDVRSANLGLLRSDNVVPRVLLLDWQFVGSGSPGVDLAWYLYCAGPGRRTSHEAGIACYRDCLGRRLGNEFDDAWWQPQLELSLLGQMVRLGHDMAWAALRHDHTTVRDWARGQLTWWSAQTKAAARLL
jgi:hypothetical protein